MKILFIHNEYGKLSGEEHALRELEYLLIAHGHGVIWYRKTSKIINVLEKLNAFILGVYNPRSARELDAVLDTNHPDIAMVQNLYPFISSSIFKVLKKRKVPVVMRCPNYRLFCPNGLCLDTKGRVCEKCFGNGKEFWCIRKNCEKSFGKSLGYAIRGWYSRVSGNVIKGVDRFVVQSQFQKTKFVKQGINENRISILPGIAPTITHSEYGIGDYCAFVGRVSDEKGIYEFIEAAQLNPNISFKVAGALSPNFRMPTKLPENLEFVGFKVDADLDDFYQKSRLVVVPSKWYEGFPNVIHRAMVHRKPIITTDIGGLPEIIKNGVNGIVVKLGDIKDLANAIANLYINEELCKQYGVNGYRVASERYSSELIYCNLLEIYESIQYRH